jgi:hypothetical protein
MEHGALGIEHRAKRVVVNTRNVVLPVFAQVVVFKKSPYICSREAGGGLRDKEHSSSRFFYLVVWNAEVAARPELVEGLTPNNS